MNVKLSFSTLLVLLFGIMSGCKKSETVDLSTTPEILKVYDDPQKDPKYSGTRIVAAGNGRFCMVYGYWNEQLLTLSFSLIPPSAPRNLWMITDKDGNLVKQGSLPSGFSIGDVLALDDNSFIIVIYDNNTNSGTYKTIQLYHFDQNGEKISEGPLQLPGDVILNSQIYSFHLFMSINGNPLLTFHHGNAGYEDFGFVGELNQSGNFLWHKQYSCLDISGCINTPDGNYIFTGNNDSLQYIGNSTSILAYRVFLFKTNSVGDSLSYRVYKTSPNCITECGNIIQANNGNYRFCFSHITQTFQPNFLEVSHGYIYEVNSNGDSVNAIVISLKNQNRLETIVPQNDGGIFALMNSTDMISVSSPALFYDTYYNEFGIKQVNTSIIKMDANLNMTSTGVFQDKTTDLFKAACKTHDGRIASFGLIQSYHQGYYKPALIILP